jgi:hypothetical protein
MWFVRFQVLTAAYDDDYLLMQTGKDAHPHLQTNKTWSVLKQQFLETEGNFLRKLLQDWALMLLVLGAYLWCSNHLYAVSWH